MSLFCVAQCVVACAVESRRSRHDGRESRTKRQTDLELFFQVAPSSRSLSCSLTFASLRRPRLAIHNSWSTSPLTSNDTAEKVDSGAEASTKAKMRPILLSGHERSLVRLLPLNISRKDQRADASMPGCTDASQVQPRRRLALLVLKGPCHQRLVHLDRRAARHLQWPQRDRLVGRRRL